MVRFNYLLAIFAMSMILTLMYFHITVFKFDYDYFRRRVSDVQHLLPQIAKEYTNIPKFYLDRSLPRPHGVNKSCAQFPTIFELNFNNDYWQTLYTSVGPFYLLNAYYDDRLKEKYVRIVSMITLHEMPLLETFCYIWYEGRNEPFIQNTTYEYIWQYHWGGREEPLQPYLISCPTPQEKNNQVPTSVSLVEEICADPTTNLRVIYNKPRKRKDFAVCVKGIDFEDDNFSIRLIEWLELIHMLGADKVFLHYFNVQKMIMKIFAYYENVPWVKINHISLCGDQPNVPPLQHKYLGRLNTQILNEVITYNDCFYKHMYEYDFMVFIDLDEIIMPLQDKTWIELINRLNKKENFSKQQPDSVVFLNTYFLDGLTNSSQFQGDIPESLHILQHVYRTRNHTPFDQYPKSFFNTNTIKTVHNHRPFKCIPDRECYNYYVDTSIGHMAHYRKTCSLGYVYCPELKRNVVKDDAVLRFKNELANRVMFVARNLDLTIN